MVAVALVVGYAPIKRAGVDAVEIGARVGAAWLASEPNPVNRQGRAAAAQPATGGLQADGALELPISYGEWVLVGSATGLAYGEATTRDRHSEGPGVFTHVYLEPGASHHFRQTGQFPEGTVFALEMREPTASVSIARDGWFAGALRGVHAAIKDTERFGGWAYFDVDAFGAAQRVRTPVCSTCHSKHGGLDNVFVQFYPALTEATR